MRLSLCCTGTFVIYALLAGCTPDQGNGPKPTGPASLASAMAKLENRPQWNEHPPLNVTRHPAEKYLSGWVVVIDPGHGGRAGDADYKRGPTGVREAEMNLRIALLLERLLTDAGVRVILTRREDVDLSLAARAEVANNAKRPDGGTGADLFLSLHHNLAPNSSSTNYTSMWYHAEADWSEPSLDVARYLAHAIGRALRTDVGYASPLMSDRQMYQGGFGVLRNLKVPGVLLESSFYSQPAEEQRLRDADYNLREAHAIYEALCEYAYGGRPTQNLPSATQASNGRTTITTTLNDGLPDTWAGANRQRILTSTVYATVDGLKVPHKFNAQSRRLVLHPGTLATDRPHVLSIHHANLFKQHNWPQRYRLTPVQGRNGVTWRVEPVGQVRARSVP